MEQLNHDSITSTINTEHFMRTIIEHVLYSEQYGDVVVQSPVLILMRYYHKSLVFLCWNEKDTFTGQPISVDKGGLL